MKKLAVIATALTLAACAGTPVPPAVPPSDFSTRPAIAETGFAETVVVQDFPLERSELRAWLADGNKIIAAMDGGEDFAGPVDEVYFDGTWPEPGSTRRVELSDGHYVLERVINNAPAAFEYQIWNMTNEVGNNVDYVHGIQAFEPLEQGGTRLTWTYKVMPNAGFKRPFVQRTVNKHVKPMLRGALETVAADANNLVQDKVN